MAIGGDDPSFETAPITGTQYHVNKALAGRINRMIAEAPPQIQPELIHAVSSGERSHSQQAAAYARYLAGGGLAAPPGHSWHERAGGMAVDWNHASPVAGAYLRENAGRYGLGFPLGSRDPWHMEPAELYAGSIHSRPVSFGIMAPHIRSAESSGNYYNLYGGGDARKYPAGKYGFPQWGGRQGPQGLSTAAGGYGITETEWNRYAPKLGITDFSPKSQDRIAEAIYAEEGMKPWRFNPKLAGFSGSTRGLPYAYGDLDRGPMPDLNIQPINKVPFGEMAADAGGPRTITTPPVRLPPPPPFQPMRPVHVSLPHSSNVVASALGNIIAAGGRGR